MNFESVSAIVSGGASGLGQAVSESVIAAGGRVAMLDINEDQGQQAAQKLGDRAVFVHTDVSDEKAVDSAVEQAAKRFGSLTLAVNCAGIIGTGRVLGHAGPMPGDYFAKVIEVNLIGSFLLTKAAATVMQNNEPTDDGERGVIVSTASIAAFEGQIGQAAYSASKGGIVGMTLPLAREFARIGVRVVTVAPGIFMTPMMAGLPQEVQDSLGAQVPFPPRLGRPDEFASMVRTIYETPMLNGTTVRLDGGIRMQPK